MKTQNNNDSDEHYKPIFQTKVLAEIIIFVALAGALSLISHSFFSLPQSGSINLGMLPIFWLAIRRGAKIGIFTGAIFGVVDLAVTPSTIVHPAQFVIDYPLAFACLGLAGLFRNLSYFGPAIGVVFGGLGRYLCHFISGVVYFSMFAPEGMSPVLYSAIYNATYMVPSIIICTVLIMILKSSKLLDIYK